jgi:hypothetical protein
MSGPSGQWHAAERRHLRVCREAAWGECPAEPDWTAVPIWGDGFRLRAVNSRFSPDTFYGGWRRSVLVSHFVQVGGTLVTQLRPETAAFVLGMALDRSPAGEAGSYALDFYTPAGPRRYLGAMAEAMRLELRAADGEAVLALRFRAKDERANDELSESDFDYSALGPVPFRFAGAQVSVDGAAVTGVERLLLEVRNNLAAGPNRLGRVAFLLAGRREVSVELAVSDDGPAFLEAVRDGAAVSLEAALRHPAGHRLTIALPLLQVESVRPEAAPGTISRATVHMEAAVGETGDDVTYTLEPAAP